MSNPNSTDKPAAQPALAASACSARFHLYTAPMQAATNFVDRSGEKPMRVRCQPHALRWCYRCRQRRRANNLMVQVFYDHIRYWCKDSKCDKR